MLLLSAMKPFQTALKDGFVHILDTADPAVIDQLRREHVQIDQDGYYSFTFGDKNEFELAIEPLQEEGHYQIALYRNRITLTEKIDIWTKH